MNTQTQPQATNDLRHTIITKDFEGNTMRINIRLNDECKNGHQDFAITADIWQKDKPMNDRWWIMGGCCHEEILKVHPELKIFVDLHLCDYKGIPMHASANGFYHLRNGFNNCKPEDYNFEVKYCQYYRISSLQFQALTTCENEVQFAIKLQDLGILHQWEEQALTAIEELQKMTKTKFIVDSKRTQFIDPTPEQLAEEKQKQESGYYTPEAKEQRKKELQNKLMFDLREEERKKIDTIREEYAIKAQVLQIGGKAALDNCIYYNHNRQLTFNWRGYENISSDLIKKITAEIKLPEGATIKVENKK